MSTTHAQRILIAKKDRNQAKNFSDEAHVRREAARLHVYEMIQRGIKRPPEAYERLIACDREFSELDWILRQHQAEAVVWDDQGVESAVATGALVTT